MTQIELAYTDVINVDMLESILEQKFPGKSVSRQNWGINAPFVWIKMSFWIRVVLLFSVLLYYASPFTSF